MTSSSPGSRFFLAVMLLMLTSCSETPDKPAAAEFRVGATRLEILQAFGPPAQEQLLHKSSNPIWGPIEDFWPQVPIGSKVQIWSYEVQGGRLELYFVDGSSLVQGTGFAPEGAVYEPEKQSENQP